VLNKEKALSFVPDFFFEAKKFEIFNLLKDMTGMIKLTRF